jgi:hypothetical protein
MKNLLYLLLLIPSFAYSQGWSTRMENNSEQGKILFARVEGKSDNDEKPAPGLEASFSYKTMMTRWHLVGVPFLSCKIDQYPLEIKFSGEDKVYKAYGWGEKKSSSVWIQLLPGNPVDPMEISEQAFRDKVKAKKTIFIKYITECGTFSTEFPLNGSERAINGLYKDLPKEE